LQWVRWGWEPPVLWVEQASQVRSRLACCTLATKRKTRSHVDSERSDRIPPPPNKEQIGLSICFLFFVGYVHLENPTNRNVCQWFERVVSRGRSRFCLWLKATKSKMRSPVYSEPPKTIPPPPPFLKNTRKGVFQFKEVRMRTLRFVGWTSEPSAEPVCFWHTCHKKQTA
jgi:hypothetical protein